MDNGSHATNEQCKASACDTDVRLHSLDAGRAEYSRASSSNEAKDVEKDSEQY